MMGDSKTVRITKPTSKRLVMLKKMTGIPKCLLIEKALKNYIPMENVRK